MGARQPAPAAEKTIVARAPLRPVSSTGRSVINAASVRVTRLYATARQVIPYGNAIRISSRCDPAWKIGSDALLVQIGLCGPDDTSLEQIEPSTTVHLSFDELELGDLAFGLTIRPARGDRRGDRGLIFYDAIGE